MFELSDKGRVYLLKGERIKGKGRKAGQRIC